MYMSITMSFLSYGLSVGFVEFFKIPGSYDGVPTGSEDEVT